MPVKVYVDDDTHTELAWLCDDNWRLEDQLNALSGWLKEHRSSMKPGRYIADVGFSPRDDAAGGGAALSPEMLRTMADIGMSLYLSEYPPVSNSNGRAT